MTYPFSLFSVGAITGSLLLIGHLIPLFLPMQTRDFLRGFARSEWWGRVLLLIATAWAVALVRSIDLGEFAALRNTMTVGVLVAAGLTWKFVDEFLSVRALAILGLLAAEILLCAAYLQPQGSRLFLVFLAYGWILAGLFLVGIPWWLRDVIEWVLARSWRLPVVALAGVFYGLTLLFCAFAFYRN